MIKEDVGMMREGAVMHSECTSIVMTMREGVRRMIRKDVLNHDEGRYIYDEGRY